MLRWLSFTYISNSYCHIRPMAANISHLAAGTIFHIGRNAQ